MEASNGLREPIGASRPQRILGGEARYAPLTGHGFRTAVAHSFETDERISKPVTGRHERQVSQTNGS